ncbi:MAG: hypothetical protein WBC82_06045 [Dehalococcoidia bacterium]
MPRCGDCKSFHPEGANPAANTGLCVAFLDEDGLPKITDLYMDASECEKFTPLDRVRTKTSEFMSSDPKLRIARGFDEK